EQVLLGPDGLLSGLEPGSVWIDMSTSVPAVAGKVRAMARDIAILDAPVAGRVQPLLEAMGDPERILYVGPHGSGYTVKLMLNLLWFSHLVATAEVLTIGTQAGVDLATLRRCLLASQATSTFLEHDVLSVLERGDYDDSFALALACKDLGLAVDLAGAVGVSVELSAVVEQVYRRARAQYGDAGGEMLPIKLYEDLTRTPLRLPPVSASGSLTPPSTLKPPSSLTPSPSPTPPPPLAPPPPPAASPSACSRPVEPYVPGRHRAGAKYGYSRSRCRPCGPRPGSGNGLSRNTNRSITSASAPARDPAMIPKDLVPLRVPDPSGS